MRISQLVLAALLISADALAAPVPGTVPFTGRLADSNGPLNGVVSLKFQVFDAATGGTAVWLESYPSNTVTNGLVFFDLGSQTTLDASIFNGGTKYLEVSINGTPMTPRLAIGSAPYAIHAGTADTLGALAETDVQRRVSGACASGAISTINDDGTVVCATVGQTYTGANGISVAGTTIGLSTTGCSSGNVWKYNGATWNCQADANTVYTGSSGINVNGTNLTLESTGCNVGYVWKFNGATWACQPDANTQYTGFGGVNVNGSTVSLSTTGCGIGYVWKFNGGSFGCQPDANTTYTAGQGLTISGTTVSLQSQSCAAGYVWKFDGANWNCQPDAVGSYSAGEGIAIGGGAVSLQKSGCSAGDVWKFDGVGWNCVAPLVAGAGIDITNAMINITQCPAGNTLQATATGWTCAAAGNGTITGIGTPVAGGLVGGVPSGQANLSIMTCNPGDTLKQAGFSWGCSPTEGAAAQTNANAVVIGGVPVGVASLSVNLPASPTGRLVLVSQAELLDSSATAHPVHCTLYDGAAAIESWNWIDGTSAALSTQLDQSHTTFFPVPGATFAHTFSLMCGSVFAGQNMTVSSGRIVAEYFPSAI